MARDGRRIRHCQMASLATTGPRRLDCWAAVRTGSGQYRHPVLVNIYRDNSPSIIPIEQFDLLLPGSVCPFGLLISALQGLTLLPVAVGDVDRKLESFKLVAGRVSWLQTAQQSGQIEPTLPNPREHIHHDSHHGLLLVIDTDRLARCNS
ncbi:hypothetical protein VTK26DRAFT_5815 [Humicola hyalothermophila]